MAARIEDYALIGDCEAAALVGRDGSLDWLCWPRFDSPACFAALLAAPEHGRWLIAPVGGAARTSRAYRPDTLVLDTRFETPDGAVMLTDLMPLRGTNSDVVRRVAGLEGQIRMRVELIVRFDHGRTVPLGQPPGRRQPAPDRRPQHAGAADGGALARGGLGNRRRVRGGRRGD